MAVPLSPPASAASPPPNHGAEPIPLRPLRSDVHHARVAVTQMLAGLVPAGHLDDVVLVTSELVTNAIAAARRYADVMQAGWPWDPAPILLSVYATERWTRIDVQDPEPYVLPRAELGPLPECGRGLQIVDALGHHATSLYARCKVMHAVVPIGNEPLTAAELAAALPHPASRLT